MQGRAGRTGEAVLQGQGEQCCASSAQGVATQDERPALHAWASFVAACQKRCFKKQRARPPAGSMPPMHGSTKRDA